MVAVFVTLTPGCWNEFIDCQNTKVRIAVIPMVGVKPQCNSTPESLEQAYQFEVFTHQWLKNPKYKDYWPLFTTQDEWTIVKYVIEDSRTFHCWTLSMSKWHMVLCITSAVYNDTFDHKDGVMQAFPQVKNHSKEDLSFTVQVARQQLNKYSSENTPTTGVDLS